MDGTLVPRKTSKILPSTIEAINKAKANGHYVFLCTGRGLSMALEHKDVIDIPGVIFCNGGGILYNGELIYQVNLPFEQIVPLTMVIDSLDGSYMILNEDHCYYNPKNGKRLLNNWRKAYPGYTDEQILKVRGMVPILEYDGKPIQKVDFMFESELTADIFFARIPEDYSVVTSGGYFARLGRRAGEIMAPGVTKGSAIKKVIELFNGDLKDAYGFGDSTNDLEMFDICGTAIAMGNATTAVKEKADYVTDDCDSDGIYNAMKHFNLI